MKILRTLFIWILATALPVQGFASVAMTHCKDARSTASMDMSQMPAHHDHAAMMAKMAAQAADAKMAEMGQMNHAVKQVSSQVDSKSFKFGCECGCKCGNDCGMSCAVMAVTLITTGVSVNDHTVDFAAASPRGQAHAAYRYEPLRPPTTVVL